ncbi:unnamed protein product [Cylicocyclus nassatus]|uniref:Uncharacterized protein n=1 Tax=Cylicocyclus nassatus TaxID=53992 RepID=A0AA36H2X7_CYLNA|nr:unnamed protein product [Cylicocyclus nassatus]
MSFKHFYAEEHPEAMFTRCPACATCLIIDNPKRFSNCACPRCRCYFCHYCHSEPHWPMGCDEFKKWREIWDEQYVVEKLCPADDEKVLRIKCICGQVFHACESLAHGTYCPNHCGHRFDKVGLMRNQRDLFRCLTPRERQLIILRDGEIVKKGIPISTTFVELKGRIRKKYAFALFLVENGTAWLYLHKNHNALRHLLSDVLKLLNLVKSIERNMKLRDCSSLLELKKEVFDLIRAFQRAKSL